jgi:hypothetical protein
MRAESQLDPCRHGGSPGGATSLKLPVAEVSVSLASRAMSGDSESGDAGKLGDRLTAPQGVSY